jgi:RNA polymerase sigma factor (sigma-70 family)
MIAPSDAQLVSGVLAGDRGAFAQVYDRYADRLHDFAYSMLRHREDAADAVADAFVTTAERLDQLRDPERLRPWLYAVVRRECLRRLKARSRTAYGGDEDLLDLPDQSATPETAAEQDALRSLVWDAAGGLNERDRAMLDLHLRQGLDGAELGEAMGMSADNAYVALSRLRDQVERSIGALLVARTSRQDCTELTHVLDDWDGQFTPLVRKRVARHVDRCRACTGRRAVLASPAALLAGVPAFAAPLLLRDRVLEDSRLVSALAARRDGGGAGSGPAGPPGSGHPRRGGRPAPRTMWAAAAALFLTVAGVVGVVVAQDRTAQEPQVLAEDTSTPTSDAPTPSTEPSPGQEVTQVPAPSLSPVVESSLEVTPEGEVTAEVSAEPTGQPTTTEPNPSDSGETTTPPAPPGRLVATPRRLDLGDSGSRTLTLRNAGGTKVTYSVDVADGWLSARPGTGSLGPGQTRSVRIIADRTGLPEGASAGGLTVTWAGRTLVVPVTVSRNAGPLIGVPSTSQARCDSPVFVTVAITDESGVASATLAWNGPSGVAGSTPMTRRADVWVGRFAPGADGGTFQLTVTATDTLGNSATRTASVDVAPCAG